MTHIQAIANNWAKRVRRCGFRVGLRFEVGGDGGSVLILVTREDGQKMRMNFARADARRLAAEIDAASTLPSYDPFGVLKSD